VGLRDRLRDLARGIAARGSVPAPAPAPRQGREGPQVPAAGAAWASESRALPASLATGGPGERERSLGTAGRPDGGEAAGAPDTATWHDLGPVAKVGPGRPATFANPSGTGAVSVFAHEGSLYAIDDACTHEDGPLGEGEVRGTCVVCPYHDWEYDYTTGACLTDPSRPLATWHVRAEGGRIWLGPRRSAGTNARGGDHNDGKETITR
jgi:nitrite reductase/ring-hydroxylating ferredoxin subunit